MQLKIRRSQRAGGLVGGTVFFCLDVRGDYSPQERDNIRKYKLGGQVIYNSRAAQRHLANMNTNLDRVENPSAREKAAGLGRGMLSLAMAKMSLNISIDSLGRGHHIECKDLEELLEAEDTVREACKNVTRYLEVAATFDGSEVVVEYDKGAEKVHVSAASPPVLTYAPPTSAPRQLSAPAEPAPSTETTAPEQPRADADTSRAEATDPADVATTAGTGRSSAQASYGEPASAADEAAGSNFRGAASGAAHEFEQWLGRVWSNPASRKLIYYGAGIILAILVLRSCL
jgi:hypothetical protein